MIPNARIAPILAGMMFALAACASEAQPAGPPPLEGAAIGGDFTLTGEDGGEVSFGDFDGQYRTVYFGYTFCPDVCPVDAAVMAQAADLLAERGLDVDTAFISVDPARDTPQVMADFTDNLHPGMLGLTGDEAQVATAAKAYKVYYKKAVGDEPDYYLMDHSAFIYLMTAGDRFLNVFRHGETPEAVAESAACFIEAVGKGA